MVDAFGRRSILRSRRHRRRRQTLRRERSGRFLASLPTAARICRGRGCAHDSGQQNTVASGPYTRRAASECGGSIDGHCGVQRFTPDLLSKISATWPPSRRTVTAPAVLYRRRAPTSVSRALKSSPCTSVRSSDIQRFVYDDRQRLPERAHRTPSMPRGHFTAGAVLGAAHIMVPTPAAAHPDYVYALGAHRGGINERCFVDHRASNGPGTTLTKD